MHVTTNTAHTFICLTHINVIAGAILLALPAGIAYDFVGELDDLAYGRDGTIDPAFDPHHHGLAGFGNAGILSGGTVPTPPDVLAAQQAAGKRITLVDMHAALTADDLLSDGVHPNHAGMEKIAATWFAALAGER